MRMIIIVHFFLELWKAGNQAYCKNNETFMFVVIGLYDSLSEMVTYSI